MLDSIADQIDEKQDEDDDDDSKELENRLDILRGDTPRHNRVVEEESENTLVTLPLKDVEELRLKLRNLEEINEDLSHSLKDVEELKVKFKTLEDENKELAHKLKESEENQKKKEPKKKKEPIKEKIIVIDMETSEEDNGINHLVRNKENGFSRSNPQGEAHKKREINTFDCPDCENKFSKKEHMLSHQKTHEVNCVTCGKAFKSNSKLQKHIQLHLDEDEMMYRLRIFTNVTFVTKHLQAKTHFRHTMQIYTGHLNPAETQSTVFINLDVTLATFQ